MLIRLQKGTDERLAEYKDVRERDLVGREGLFVAEGEVVLRVLLSSPNVSVRSILIAENRLEPLEALLGAASPDLPIYVLPQSEMNQITGIDFHRGILAIGARRATLTTKDLLTTANRVVVIAGVANHDNVGGIFRNAAAFGIDAVLLDGASCDPFYRKAIRVSVGGVFRVPFTRGGSDHEIVSTLEQSNFQIFAFSPQGEHELAEIQFPERSALVFGAEGPGLSGAILARCTRVRIAMKGNFDSLNVAVSSGIAMHSWLVR